MKAILITTNDNINIVDVNIKQLSEKYDFYAPYNTLKYPLCLGAKPFNEFEENEDIKQNKKANEIFKKDNEYFGNIYLFLDENEEEQEKNPNHTIENLFNDILNNNLV